MISEYEFWGELAGAPMTERELEALAAAEQSEPAHLPSIVRDVRRDWAADTCCECQKSLEHEITVHIHAGNAYCGRCYHAENQ